jgi:hypothetical protein
VSLLEARAERLRLAHLLGRDLPPLEGVPAEALAELREQVTDLLFEADRPRLAGTAAAGARLPAPLVATLAQRAFGPRLAARIVGLLDPERAIDLAGRLPVDFLADVAQEMDPRRASAVVGGLPADLVVEVCEVLAERGDAIAMGRFVAHLDDATLDRCMEVLDAALLLRTAFTMEDKHRIDGIAAGLDDGRARAVMAVARAEGMWPEALDLLSHLGEEQRRRVAGFAAELPASALRDLAACAKEFGLLGDLVAAMPSALRAKLGG